MRDLLERLRGAITSGESPERVVGLLDDYRQEIAIESLNLFGEGKRLYGEGERVLALPALLGAVGGFRKSGTDFIEPHLLLGEIWSHLKLYYLAIAEFEEVVRLEPGSLEGYANLGFAYLDSADFDADGWEIKYDKAIANFENVLKLNPRQTAEQCKLYTFILERLAYICWDSGKNEKSIKYYEEYLSLELEDKRNVYQTYIRLAQNYGSRGDAAGAIEWLEKAVGVVVSHVPNYWSVLVADIDRPAFDGFLGDEVFINFLNCLEDYGLDEEVAEKVRFVFFHEGRAEISPQARARREAQEALVEKTLQKNKEVLKELKAKQSSALHILEARNRMLSEVEPNDNLELYARVKDLYDTHLKELLGSLRFRGVVHKRHRRDCDG